MCFFKLGIHLNMESCIWNTHTHTPFVQWIYEYTHGIMDIITIVQYNHDNSSKTKQVVQHDGWNRAKSNVQLMETWCQLMEIPAAMCWGRQLVPGCQWEVYLLKHKNPGGDWYWEEECIPKYIWSLWYILLLIYKSSNIPNIRGFHMLPSSLVWFFISTNPCTWSTTRFSKAKINAGKVIDSHWIGMRRFTDKSLKKPTSCNHTPSHHLNEKMNETTLATTLPQAI